MYKIEGRWAGYVLTEQQVRDFSDVEEAIGLMKETFLEGMVHHVQGTAMKVTTLCVDVFLEGKIVWQTDFKL
jgi:hypothetical protein